MVKFISDLESKLPQIADKNVANAVQTARVLHKNGTNMGLAIWKAAKIFNADPKKVAKEIAVIAKLYQNYWKLHGLTREKGKGNGNTKETEDFKKTSGGDNDRSS
jgi:hypothetical protein